MTWNNTILDEDEDEEVEKRNYYFALGKASEEDLGKARERKHGHVYGTFVEPVLSEGEEMTVEEVKDEIRPPYSGEEVRGALKYGVENEGLEYVSGKGSVKKI